MGLNLVKTCVSVLQDSHQLGLVGRYIVVRVCVCARVYVYYINSTTDDDDDSYSVNRASLIVFLRYNFLA